MGKKKTKSTSDTVAGVSSQAVLDKTGKTWEQWLKTLDAAGANTMTHKEIVAILKDKHAVDPWWRQMVTVGYEQTRGLRKKHEMTGGFEVSVSKTINVPLGDLFLAVKDARRRKRWLTLPDAAPAKFAIRKATENKSLRVTWADEETSLNVHFWDKGPGKAQVVVQHVKLKNKTAADKAKAYWRDQLAALKTLMES